MKPTPTPEIPVEMVLSALDDYKAKSSKTIVSGSDFGSGFRAGYLAALSVPAAAVVGEPVAWMHTLNMEFGQKSVRFASAESDQPFGKPGIDFSEEYTVTITPLYAAVHSAPDGWQSIESAPHACHVIACYFYECEWIYDVVLSPPSPPFTHWKMLPAPPALGGKP